MAEVAKENIIEAEDLTEEQLQELEKDPNNKGAVALIRQQQERKAKLTEAQKIIEQEKLERATRCLEEIEAILKKHNCKMSAEMAAVDAQIIHWKIKCEAK